MGRGGNEITAEQLLYGRKSFQDGSIDSAEPSPLAKKRAAALLEAYHEGNLEMFRRGLSGTERQVFGNTPLVDELVREVASIEVDNFIARHKLKKRARGAADEREDLARSLSRVVHQRAQEWDPHMRRIIGAADLRQSALRRKEGGPITEHFLSRIASDSNLGGVENHQTLALLMSENASPEARAAFEQNLKRTAVSVYQKFGVLTGSDSYYGRYSTNVGYLRRASGALLLHLRQPNGYYTVCGKSNVRSANFGSWADSEISDRYRQCKECLKEATPEALALANGERLDTLPIAGAEDQIDKIISSPAVLRVLKRASQSEEAFNEIVSGGESWRTEHAAELRAAMAREMLPIVQAEQDKVLEKEPNNTAIYHPIWEDIPRTERRQLAEQGYQVGYRWSSAEDLESQDWANVFTRELRHRLAEKHVEKVTSNIRGDYDKTHDLDRAIRKTIQREVRKFLSSAKAASK